MSDNPIAVVAGVLRDRGGRILLTQRGPGKDFAGHWEFPGGKVEAGESLTQALQRELHEELGIEVRSWRHLIRIPWDYPHKRIVLDVFDVVDYAGTPLPLEGQALAWHALAELAQLAMPPADRPVVTALRLPTRYAISPEPVDTAAFLAALDRVLGQGVQLLQLRAKSASPEFRRELALLAQRRCRDAQAMLLLNGDIDLARELDLDGVHLTSAQLVSCAARPLPRHKWLAASCHNEAELRHAKNIGVDFVTLSPVLPTTSHPGAAALGWDWFASLCAQAAMPVYALGGLHERDLAMAQAHGAQGIAAISAFWR